ncbi:Cell wall assembly regulator [Cryptotrichosporon argae]
MPLLQSLGAFFGQPTRAGRAPRRQPTPSTRDAFSLPTTAARFGDGPGVPDVPQADGLASPGPSRRGSYATYPPPKDAYRPALAYFPPLSHTFHRLRNALADVFPELLETLNRPVDPLLLAEVEQELGCPLPPPVRDAFLVADGQDFDACARISGSGGLFYGLHLMPLDEVMREWAFWRQVERDPTAGRNAAVLATMASIPPGWIKRLYACRGWLPLVTDRAGNYVGVDLDPGEGGEYGQVIVFGRDFDRKCVLWRGEGAGGWGKWLAGFVDELESGEGWEAERAGGSDDDEAVGYTSYSGATEGEAGGGLRLAGEYRGWNVLEAWWDKSVRQWEKRGLGLDVEQVERGLDEARKLAGLDGGDKGKGKEIEGLGLGVGNATAATVESSTLAPASPQLPPHAPPTPVQADVDSLLPPTSPDQPPLPRIQPPSPVAPVRILTAVSDHPLADADVGDPCLPRLRGPDSGFLSPPTGRSPPRNSRRTSQPLVPVPAPASLDLPTRADVQAAQAVAQAEASGLRGGWVMNLDTSAGAASRRIPRGGASDMDAEMVDIDLEGGRGERFGSPRMSDADAERQAVEERLALAGLEHRRRSPVHMGITIPSRTPSPLSTDRSAPSTPGYGSDAEQTPRAASREPFVPAVPGVPTPTIQRPPRVASWSDRARTPDGEREASVIRGPVDGGAGIGPGPARRMQRQGSVMSADSREGLLEWTGGGGGPGSGGKRDSGASTGSAASRASAADSKPDEVLDDVELGAADKGMHEAERRLREVTV